MSNVELEIVLAHYNGISYVMDQIQSIYRAANASQTKFHLLVVDDASQISQYVALEKIVSGRPEITLIRNEKNLGVIKSFEKGLRMTTSKYVMLSDQDDIWIETKISKSLEEIRKCANEPALVFSDLKPVTRDLVPLGENMLHLSSFDQNEDRFGLVLRNLVAGCTTIMNRELLKIALPFPSEITMHDHWLALCAAFGGKIAFLNEPTILYRQHGLNLVGNSRGLTDRLKHPWQSFRRLDESLRDKAAQADALLKRIHRFSYKGDDSTLLNICRSLDRRNFKSLLTLRKNGALRTFGSSQIAFWPAYVLTSLIGLRGAQ